MIQLVKRISYIMRYSLFASVIKTSKLNILKRKWRINNSHNITVPNSMFNIDRVFVGNETYGRLNVVMYDNNSVLKIGHFVSIADNVTYIIGGEHHLNHISTFPYQVLMLHQESSEAFGKGDIVVDDDVWIGYGATIMSGVHIGQGAVIAAGAVVTKDVPAYAVVGGVPAKVIKYRFGEEMIQELMKVDFSKLTKELVSKHNSDLYMELADANQLTWLPKIN